MFDTLSWPDLSGYIEKEIISARFILALAATLLFGWGKMDITVYGIIVAFYFGNHPASVAAARARGEPKLLENKSGVPVLL
jgi:hypothetical protein